MIALIDFDSHLYSTLTTMFPLSDVPGQYPKIGLRTLLKSNRHLSWQERKPMIFNYIIQEVLHAIALKQTYYLEVIENTGIVLTEYRYYLTYCKNSLRERIYPEYKANRKKDPKKRNQKKYINEIRKRLIEIGGYIYDDEYEADDLIKDDAYSFAAQGKEYLIVSIDKDLNTIPGMHFNFYRNYRLKPDGTRHDIKGLSYVTQDEANYNLALQLLMGDSIDNIKGIPGIGLKKAKDILFGAKTYYSLMRRVTVAYIQNTNKFADKDWQANLYMNYRLIYLGKT